MSDIENIQNHNYQDDLSRMDYLNPLEYKKIYDSLDMKSTKLTNWVDSPRSPSFIFFNLHQQPVGAHPRLRYMWRRSWERPLRIASKTDAKLPKPRSLNSIEKKIKWINREELRFIYIKPNRRRRETIKNSFDCRWLTLQNRLLEKRNRLSEHKIRSIIDRKFYTDQKTDLER